MRLMASFQVCFSETQQLKLENIVCVNKSNRLIIRREDVTSWRAVKNGYYTETEALLIFDKIFKGE